MLQKINPLYQSVLLQLQPEIGNNESDTNHNNKAWDTKFEDPERQAYHDRKMKSKDIRPAKQLAAMGILSGTVVHEIVH